MLIVIYAIWLLLNAHFALDIQFLEIAVIGLIISIAVYLFMIKYTKWSFKTDIFFIKHIHLFIVYFIVLFYNIIKSNFAVMKVILKRGEKPSPAIVNFEVNLNNDLLRTILANSITLTPGTITITCKDNKYIIHCLKKEFFDDFENSTMVKLLKKMEEHK